MARSRQQAGSVPAGVSLEEVARVQADALQNIAGAAYLSTVVAATIGNSYRPESYVEYRNQLLKQCGDPTDPLEVMLLEQIAMAHHAIGRLRLKSAITEPAGAAVAYSDAGTRLLAEMRRCVLGLEDYRTRRSIRGHTSHGSERDKTAGSGPESCQSTSRTAEKTAANAKQPSNGNGGGIPAWLKKRMAYPTPAGSQPGAETVACGEG